MLIDELDKLSRCSYRQQEQNYRKIVSRSEEFREEALSMVREVFPVEFKDAVYDIIVDSVRVEDAASIAFRGDAKYSERADWCRIFVLYDWTGKDRRMSRSCIENLSCDKDWVVRCEVASQLGCYDGEEGESWAISILRQMSLDTDSRVSKEAKKSLSELGETP